jgi:hypothetical protein
MRDRLRAAWQRFRHDETGAVCVGCGLDVVDGVLLPKLKADGGIVCDGDGLHVVFPAGVVVPGVSPDACNGFVLRGNGYYSPCPDAVTGIIQNDSINNDLLPLAITAGGGPYTFTSGTANTLSNPLCCDVSGIIAIRAGGLFLDAANTFYGSCHMQVNPNGAGLVNASPDTTKVFENKSGSNLHTDFNGFVDENHIVIPAGGSITYAAALVVDCVAGSGTLSGVIKFEYVITLPQSGCC